MFLHSGRIDPDRRRSYTGLLPPCKEFGALVEEAEDERSQMSDEDGDENEVVHSLAMEQALDDLRRGSIDEEVMSLTLVVPQKLVCEFNEQGFAQILCKCKHLWEPLSLKKG